MMRVLGLATLLAAASAVATPGPVGYWRLDGDLADSAGSHTGAAVGTITFTNAVIASGGFFSNSYANVGVVLSTNAYTKAAWINRIGGGNNNILSGENVTNRHAFFCPSGNSYRLAAGHNGSWSTVIDSVAIPSGTWTHVAVTYDRTVAGGTLRLYRNGRLVPGAPVATNIAPPSGGLCLVGGWDLAGVNGLYGQIDDAAVWDRALSDAEIEQLYKAGAHHVGVGAATGFQYAVYGRVPEATNYAVVYDYDVPAASALGAAGLPAYTWNDAAAYGSTQTFDRVAYYLELWTNAAVSAQWVYVSMDAFTSSAARIGVPCAAAGGTFQQLVTNMNVFGGGGLVATGTAINSGNIEFWGLNYTTNNAAGIPNASHAVYDVGDQILSNGYHGSMQVHNHAVGGSTTTETIFAYNAWGDGNADAIGIGRRPTSHPDWTFATNAASFASRTLLVLARPVAAPAVAFTNRPASLQVYPRNPLTGGAAVRIDGAVQSLGDTGIVVRVLRNGVAFTNQALALAGTGGEPFAFEPLIYADGAAYDFSVVVNRPGFEFVAYSAAGVTVALPLVAFTNRPAHLQLYPRAPGATSAVVRIDGAVVETGCTAMALTVLRNGAPYASLPLSLSGAGGEPFAFAPAIGAELASFDLRLTITCAGIDYVVLAATNVVAGDALLVSGQSNAEARQFNGSANSNQSNWVRSYGNRTTAGATVQADLAWYLAEGDAVHASGAVGQWPLRMARVMVDSSGVPLAVINHAEGGQPISFFRRNDTMPEDLNTNYGQMLYRVRHAGLAQAVRAILWFQGESDTNNAPVHAAGFLALCEDWRTDFTPAAPVYVCQLNNAACGGSNLVVREFQRLLQDQYPGFVVHSTSGLRQHTDNCHYPYELGYRVLGDQLARLLLRDLYAAPMPSQVAAPNIASAWFTDGTGAEVAFRTRNPADALSMGNGAQTNFLMEGVAAAVLSVTSSGNEVHIVFDRDVRAGSGLSFPGQPGGAPFLTNALGVGLLYFYNQPVAPALATPAAPSGLAAYAVRSNIIDLAWAAAAGAAGYAIERNGLVLSTSAVPWFRDGAVTAGVTYAYRVAAGNPSGTSAWSAAVSTSTVPYNVFRQVAEAADYDVLYALDVPDSAQLGATGRIAYAADASAVRTAGIRRVAYHLELQTTAGTATRWAYASMRAFSTNPLLLGVPVITNGAVFQQPVTDLNVYASAGAGVTSGLHLASGNIEFWGYNYGPMNRTGVPNAGDALYDWGDSNSVPVGTYGSMQLHNNDLDGAGPGTNGQTILAWNRWGNGGVNDLGLGNDPDLARANWNPDYTFAQNAQGWDIRTLTVLVLTDADNDGLPDAWERAHFGDLSHGPADQDDGDGLDNAAEYLAGTDPADGADFPRARIEAAGGPRLRFQGAAGRSYELYATTSLVDQAWLPTGQRATGAGAEVVIPVTNAEPNASYQLRMGPP